MRRIMVLGPCGSGKSTLAGEIARRLAIPVYHMDLLSWRSGWVEASKDEIAASVEAIVSEPAWVIDGNDGATLPQRLARADTVLFLDYPIPLCFWRVLKRVARWRGRPRPDMPEGCPERFDAGFMLYVARWNHGPRQRLEGYLRGHESKIVRLASPAAAEKWLDALPPHPEAARLTG